MTSRDRDRHLDAELDATLAALTAIDRIEARSRAKVLAALDRDRGSPAWWRTPSLRAVAAGVVLLIAGAVGSVWNRSSPDNATRPDPLAIARRIVPPAPNAPPIVGVQATRVEATGVAPGRKPRPTPPWPSWEGELPRLIVPPLEQPDAIAAARLTIDEVTLSPIDIAGIEIGAVDESPSPAPHP